jgi:hypothetical protein
MPESQFRFIARVPGVVCAGYVEPYTVTGPEDVGRGRQLDCIRDDFVGRHGLRAVVGVIREPGQRSFLVDGAV